jgi:flagellar basal body-associated protein FliL
MNSIRSSETAIGVLLVVALVTVAAGTAVALTVEGTSPEPAQTNSTVTMAATIQQPFSGDAPAQYTLRGETELENASFTVVAVDQQNSTVNRVDSEGPTFEMPLDIDNGSVRVEMEVNDGVVPPLDTFDYEDMSVENYTALRLVRVADGAETEISVYETHRFTEESIEARQAIDNASALIDADSSSDAREKLNQSISAYNAENFENAISLAQEARSTAESGGLPVTLIGGAVVVLVVIVGAVVYVRSSSGGDDYKLQ